MFFGEKFREIRLSKNISQTELGNLTGFARIDISLWENREDPPSMKTLKILASALKTPESFFLFSNPKKEAAEVLEWFEKDVEECLMEWFEKNDVA